MDSANKYGFEWGHLGDIGVGRPNLGPTVGVATYRLMQYSFRDVLEQRFGTEEADEIFRDAGRLAGSQYAQNTIGKQPDFPAFVKAVQDALRDSKIGVVRIEEASEDARRFVLTVSEDLDCSGLPELGYEVCAYDEGFIAALLESHTGVAFDVNEIDCWCTGDRTCRFEAMAVS